MVTPKKERFKMETYAWLILGFMFLVVVLASLPLRRRSSNYITCHKCGKNTLEVLTRHEAQSGQKHARLVTYLVCHNSECNYASHFVEDKLWIESGDTRHPIAA